MAGYHGLEEDDFYYGILGFEIRGRITKVKYGGISTLENMPVIRKCIEQGKLIDVDDSREINFASKSPTNFKRIESVFKLEETIANEYNDYVFVRFDIKLMKECIKRGMDITREDLVDFIEYCRNTIRDTLAESILGGWCYGIENDTKENTHMHWNMYLDGSRYSYLPKYQAEIVYRDDMEVLINTIYRYLSNQKNNLPYCNLNVVDMTDIGSRNRLILVNKHDYKLRSCVRVLSTYICKKSAIEGKSYGKSVFKNKKMNENFLKEWVYSLDRLLLFQDYDYMNALRGGIKYHYNRLKIFFELEEEIASKYSSYLVMPFNITITNDKFNQDSIREFLKRYNSLRYNNKYLLDHEVAYCWGLNDLVSKDFTYTLYLFLNIDYYDLRFAKITDEITEVVRKAMVLSSENITREDINTVRYNPNDIIDSTKFSDRNKARYMLTIMSLLPNENQVINNIENSRLYSRSKVR